MKLLMENWREYLNEEEEYEETLELFIEYYALSNNILLTENIAADVKTAVATVVKRYGKKAVNWAMLGMLSANILAAPIAAAADLPVEDPAAMEQVQQSGPIRDWLKSDQGQEVQNQIKKTLENVKGAVKDTAQDILRPNMDANMADVDANMADGPTMDGDTHKYRLTVDVGERGVTNNLSFDRAKLQAQNDLRGLPDVPDDALGLRTSFSPGEGTEVQITVEWSPDLQADAEEMIQKHAEFSAKAKAYKARQ